MEAELPVDEEARLRDLRAYYLLDSESESTYDEIVQLASQICGTPVAVMTLIDADRQWFKAQVGLDISETGREIAFCAHAILEPTQTLVVPDATQDPRFADNPLVTGEANFRFYAGAPLVTPAGHALGTLCVLDTVPRVLTEFQRSSLNLLAREVMAHLALRRSLEESRRANLMLGALATAQSGFIIDGDPSATFTGLLDLLLTLTDSDYGFIGEVLTDEDGAPYVRVLGHAITDISWDEATHALYQEHAARGMEFHNLQTLFGAALTTRQVVIANNPGDDPRRGGLPSGHPAMHAFLGLPIYVEGQMVGLAGVANREGGYDDALVAFLEPFVATCGTLISALRANARRRDAEERLAAQNVRLRELDALKDELLATVSHELRTPLTSILSFLQLLREEAGVTASQSEALEVIDRNAHRLLDLVADLLLFASIESNALTLEQADFDLAQTARQSVDSIIPRAAARDISVDLDAAPTRMHGDERRIAQVIDNLLSNAVKFTEPGGRVRVRVAHDIANATIEVDDNGIGIPTADLPGLFERFTRAANATRGAIPGTGVGLAIVKKLTEMHGGAVSVESTEGAGARFCVTIPLREGEAE